MTTGTEVMTSNCDFNILDAFSGHIPVMLIHAVNGGYLRPDNLSPDSHGEEARAKTVLDEATREAKGHLWYITPSFYVNHLQKMAYFIESAASHEVTDNDPDTNKRRRITIAAQNPTAAGVQVGCVDKVADSYKVQKNEKAAWPGPGDNQRWIVSLTCCGGITFVPITDPNLIWGTMDHSPIVGTCPRPNYNWGCDPQGSSISTYYPRPDKQYRTPVAE